MRFFRVVSLRRRNLLVSEAEKKTLFKLIVIVASFATDRLLKQFNIWVATLSKILQHKPLSESLKS